MDKFTGRLSIQALYTLAAITKGLLQIQEYIFTHELDIDHDNLSEPFTLVVPELAEVLGNHGDAPDQEVMMLSVWAAVKRAQGKPGFSEEHLQCLHGDINHYDDNQFFAQGE